MATAIDGLLSFPATPLHCASIVQHTTALHVVALVLNHLCFKLFQLRAIMIPFLLVHENPVFEPMCVSVPFPFLQ